MHVVRTLILSLLSWGAIAFVSAGQEQPPAGGWIIESPQGAEFDLDTGIATATNGVVVRYAGAVLTARQATVNQMTGEVLAEGDVHLERYGQLWIGEKIQYNFKTRKITGENFRTGQAPFFAAGEVLVGDQAAGVYVGADGFVTTDNYAKPGYSIHARTLIIVPGEYIEARHATFHVGKVPVFYFPYVRRSLKQHPNNFVFLPGYRSLDGPFLLTSYNWYWSERLDGTLHLDSRLKRGLGFGPDFNWHLPRFGEGSVKYYYIHDDNPGLDFNKVPIHDERQRFTFFHQVSPRTNLTVRGLLRYQSDAQVVRDFFESEYRKDPQPNSFFEANQLWSNFSLDLLAQPQVNRFFETVERLPDLRVTGFRQQIGPTPLYYESESSFGYFERRFVSGSTNLPFAALRADTFHQLVVPWTFFNWLNVTPRVGGRFTHYGEEHEAGATTTERDRGVFNTGAEVSFKASRVWPEASSRFWDIDGIRHIVQPSVNYVYVPRPNVPPAKLPQFDYELASTRLLPIEFPDYNAIDSIDSLNVLRFGLKNKLQTKRKGQIQDVVNWALYTDWRLQPRTGQGTFADLYSDLFLKPFQRLSLYSETRYDLNRRFLREANHEAVFTPNPAWSLGLGHRYLRDDPSLGLNYGNNIIYSRLYLRLNENWGAQLSEHYEARDGTLEEQYYTLYRDFRSFTAAITFRIRDNRTGPKDYTVALTMSLKAFPRYDVGQDTASPSTLLGY